MIIFLLLATAYSWLRAGALPVSAGPLTDPTVIHTIVFGIHARSSCSDMRSLYDVLRGCLFTIAACVYRAVHPNIPNPEFGFWQRLKVTMKITFLALIAPELIIYWALRQWFGAKNVARRVNEAVEGRMPKLGFKWTPTHGQFMQMGGFVRKDDKTVLNCDGLTLLVDAGVVDIEDLQITEKEINDKSKGDFLSKALVVSQTSWFMFECMARLLQGLPLLEIEVVTLAFATLNAITYGLWWYKPLNILCPLCIPIRSEPLPPPPATMYTQTPSPAEDNATSTHEDQGMVAALRGVMNSVVKEVKAEIHEWGWWLPVVKILLVLPILLQAIWQTIFSLSVEAIDLIEGGGLFSAQSSGGNETTQVLSAFIGMIFGAIHFISWDANFPTHTQLTLWKASSIILVVQPFMVMLYAIAEGTRKWAPVASRTYNIADPFSLFFFFGLLLGMIPYIFARLCVLVLAFLTLRDLPPGTFTNVSWTFYIPHF